MIQQVKQEQVYYRQEQKSTVLFMEKVKLVLAVPVQNSPSPSPNRVGVGSLGIATWFLLCFTSKHTCDAHSILMHHVAWQP